VITAVQAFYQRSGAAPRARDLRPQSGLPSWQSITAVVGKGPGALERLWALAGLPEGAQGFQVRPCKDCRGEVVIALGQDRLYAVVVCPACLQKRVQQVKEARGA
jgi:hypothetical protein